MSNDGYLNPKDEFSIIKTATETEAGMMQAQRRDIGVVGRGTAGEGVAQTGPSQQRSVPGVTLFPVGRVDEGQRNGMERFSSELESMVPGHVSDEFSAG